MQTYFVTTAFTAQSMTSGMDTTNNGGSENGAAVSLEEIEEHDDGEELDELEDRLASKFCPTKQERFCSSNFK